MIYRRRPTALHAARAAVGASYCFALAGLALAADHPLVLGAVLIAVLAAGACAQVLPELGRAARIAVPLAVAIALINPLVTREGLTVIARLGEVPPVGQLDITLEATVYGLVLGLRALVVILCFALYAAAVDPDEVLRALRRVSHRSALTATLATRMVPVLARDARRLDEAQRCLPERTVPRLAVVRAVAAGALDRAADVAATLELRGYASARRPPRAHRPWSRHDLAFLAAAIGLVALATGAPLTGAGAFHAYPGLRAHVGAGEAALALAVLACAVLPFADRRGIGR